MSVSSGNPQIKNDRRNGLMVRYQPPGGGRFSPYRQRYARRQRSRAFLPAVAIDGGNLLLLLGL